MIDHKKSNALHLCRRRESKNRLARSMRTEAVVLPSFLRNFALRIDDIKRAFVTLRLRRRPPLEFLHDCSRVLLLKTESETQEAPEAQKKKREKMPLPSCVPCAFCVPVPSIHTPTPPRAYREPQIQPAQLPRRTPPLKSSGP